MKLCQTYDGMSSYVWRYVKLMEEVCHNYEGMSYLFLLFYALAIWNKNLIKKDISNINMLGLR